MAVWESIRCYGSMLGEFEDALGTSTESGRFIESLFVLVLNILKNSQDMVKNIFVSNILWNRPIVWR